MKAMKKYFDGNNWLGVKYYDNHIAYYLNGQKID